MSDGWVRDTMTSAPWACAVTILLTVFMILAAWIIMTIVVTRGAPADVRPNIIQASSENLRALADVIRALFGRGRK